jgi:hypothetical protein
MPSTATPEPRVRTLPTEADAEAICNALQHAYDLLESVEWAVNAIEKYSHQDYPERVTFEKIGILADVRSVLDVRIDDFQKISQKIDAAMFSLSTFRLEQRAGRGAGGGDA